MNRRRLYRCVHDQKIAGVCSGIAEYFDVDPTWVRVAFLLGLFMGGIGFLLYIVMAIIVPLEPDMAPAYGPWQPGSERWATPPAPGTDPAAASAEGAAPDTTQTYDPAAYADPAAAAAAGQAGAMPGQPWQGSSQWHAAYARPHRRGNAGQFFGAVLILFGAVALANEYLPDWSWTHNLWPLFILGVGVLLVAGSLRRSREQ